MLFPKRFAPTLLFLLQFLLSYGMIVDQFLSTNTPGGIAAVIGFGMARGGSVKVDYHVRYPDSAEGIQNSTSVTKHAMNEENLLMQLLVVNEDQRRIFYPGFNFETNNSLSEDACMSPVIYRKELYGNGSITHILGANDPEADLYSILLVTCTSSRKGFTVNVTTTTTLTNSLPYSTDMSHLPIELMNRMNTDVAFLIAYSFMTVGLLGQMIFARRIITLIYWLFFATLLLQINHVAVDYAYYSNVQKTGVDKPEWFVTSAFFDHSAETMVLLTFLLLSMGWSTLQFRLTQKQQWRALGSVAIYWILGAGDCLCSVASYDSGYSLICQSVGLVKYIVHALLMLAIIICVNFTIAQLRAMLAQSPWDPSTPYYYARLIQFQWFRVGFVLYLLLPTGFLLLQDLMFTWKESWVLSFLIEVLNIFVLLNVGCAFTPFQEHFLTRAFDGTFGSSILQENRPHVE